MKLRNQVMLHKSQHIDTYIGSLCLILSYSILAVISHAFCDVFELFEVPSTTL
jgi:hypothetical protein